MMSSNRTSRRAMAPVGETYWFTEFERVYLLTAGRINGKPAYARGRSDNFDQHSYAVDETGAL